MIPTWITAEQLSTSTRTTESGKERTMTEEKLSVETSAGIIVAEKNGDPGAPGIALYFIPKGCECEIDLAIAEVKEDEEYRHSGETEEDVALYVYGDIGSDQFTERIDYPRADVVKTLKENL